MVEGNWWALPVQMFPSHSTKYLSNMIVDQFLFERGLQIPLNQSSYTCRVRIHQLKAKMLLTMERSAIGVTLKNSDNAYLDAGQSVFVARAVGRGIIVRYCYVSLIYENLISSFIRFKTFEESRVKVTRKTLVK